MTVFLRQKSKECSVEHGKFYKVIVLENTLVSSNFASDTSNSVLINLRKNFAESTKAFWFWKSETKYLKHIFYKKELFLQKVTLDTKIPVFITLLSTFCQKPEIFLLKQGTFYWEELISSWINFFQKLHLDTYISILTTLPVIFRKIVEFFIVEVGRYVENHSFQGSNFYFEMCLWTCRKQLW